MAAVCFYGDEMLKKCCSCGVEKPTSEFGFTKKYLLSRCKRCESVRVSNRNRELRRLKRPKELGDKGLPCKSDEERIARFWSYVNIGMDDECWEWKAGKLHYGHGSFGSGSVWFGTNIASRIALLLSDRLLTDTRKELNALHTCNNPPCCNPKHLYWGTDQDNANDRSAVGNNAAAKLTVEKVIEIRQKYKRGVQGYGKRQLAKEYGVSQGTIHAIVNNISWRYVLPR